MVKCKKCGEENSSSAVRCKNCGEPLDKSKPANSSNFKIIAIVAVIIVIALVGVFASGILSNNSSDTTVSNTQQLEPTKTVLNNTTSTSNDANNTDSAPSYYVASVKTDKFHKPDCEWAQKVSDANKVTYPSRDDAIADGKVPCSVCNP